ncbi:MAG: ATP-binding protein [Clostridiales bacterium]|nr:ATP-binding protein [Clostridiales bacterium]
MTVQELKDKCNAAYATAIDLIENGGNSGEIGKCLLEAADLLVKVGQQSIAERELCESKARKLLDCAKRIREGDSLSDVYKTLTGEALPEKTKQVAPPKPVSEVKPMATPDIRAPRETVEQNSRKSDIVPPRQINPTPAGMKYQFNWDTLPSTSFNDVAGLDDVKDAVLRKVLLPLKNPELYEGYVKKNGGGLLLYGPPGTGKTMIAAAIAHEIGAKFCSVGASDLVLGGLGNSTKAIVNLFKEARSFSCSVIFFDEIESLCQVDTHAQHTREIRSELLRQIQGLDAYGKDDNRILFLIAATNKPWDIDPAFVRPGRFGTRIYVGLPDDKAREYMIKSRLEKIKDRGKVAVSEDIDVVDIVTKTNGFNGADMGNLLDEVQEISILRGAKTGVKIITQDDFDSALQKVTTSVQQKDLQKLEDWRNKNG